MFVHGPTGTSQQPSWARTVSMMKPTASVGRHRARHGRQLGAVHAALAVDVLGVQHGGQQRPGRARVDGRVDAEQLGHHQRVGGGAGQRGVAVHRGDAEQVGVAGGDDDGHRVVVAGVAVEDDRGAGHGARP